MTSPEESQADPAWDWLEAHVEIDRAAAKSFTSDPKFAKCGWCGGFLWLDGAEWVCRKCKIRVRPEAAPRPGSQAEPADVAQAAADASNLFGKYVRLRLLGKGGFGSVYLAWDRELSRRVAIKVIQGGHGLEVARFRREAQLMASLNHPNIVPIYEVGEMGDQFYLAMQYIDGGTVATEARSFRRAAEIVRDAARAVQAAHDVGIIHRDLKPGNIMADSHGRVFVMDFGLAKRPGEASLLSATGDVLGTPAYMAPEQARGQGDLDGRTDVYGLGATLYELLTGRVPFAGSPVEAIAKIVTEEPKSPRKLDRAVPWELEVITLKAMEKEAPRRYPTAATLADDLDRWLRGEAILARPTSVGYRLWKRVRRHPWTWGFAAALVLAALGIPAVLGIQYLRAQSLGGEGRDLAAKGRWSEARAPLERSVALWDLAENRRALEEVRRELARQQHYWAIGDLYDKVYDRLDEPLTLAEEAFFGGTPRAAEIDAILARIQETLDALPPGSDRSSIPFVCRGWTLCHLGRVEEGEAELERAVAAGGLEAGDPYGILVRAAWRLRRAFQVFQPSMEWPEGTAPAVPTDVLQSVRSEIATLTSWPFWRDSREGRHYARVAEAFEAMAAGRHSKAASICAELAGEDDIEVESFWLGCLAAYLAGDFEHAAEGFGELVDEKPRWVAVRTWRADALRAAGDPAAVEEYQGALVRNPDFMPARVGLARALRAAGERVRALEELSRVSDSWVAHAYRGVVLVELDRREEALAAFDAAAALRGGDDPSFDEWRRR